MVGNNWYVVTGGPSVGKSTLLDELAKLGYATLPEAARVVIDEGVEQGLSVEQIRNDEEAFQMKVLERKVEVEKTTQAEQITFFDRGVHDTVAYLKLYDMPLNEAVNKAVAHAAYKKVFLLEQLNEFVADYARVESQELLDKLQKLLFKAYADHGMQPVVIPACSLERRVKLILQHLR